MKLRKLLSLLLMVCVLGLLCTSCATTALDNITTYSTGTEPNRRVIIEYVR